MGVEVFEHRLHRAHDEGQADEDHGDENAERREGDFDAERLQQAANPSRWRIERRQRDAGNGGRQRKGNVDNGVEDAAAGKAIAYHRPDDDGAEDELEEQAPDEGSGAASLPRRG